MLRDDYAEVTKAGVIGSIASELALEPPEWGPREMAHCPLTFRVLCRDFRSRSVPLRSGLQPARHTLAFGALADRTIHLQGHQTGDQYRHIELASDALGHCRIARL
jgi:hypothetical protein